MDARPNGLGLALEGCSCRAAFQVGAVRWLVERGVRFDVVGGASSGSLVAAATRLDRLEDLEDRWSEMLGRTRVFEPRRLLRGRWPGRMSHVLREALEGHIGSIRMNEVRDPLVIVVTQLRLRGLVRRAITHRDDVSVARAVRASSFFPGPYSRMVPIDGRPTFDGAWQARAPIAEVRDEGAGKVLAVITKERPWHLGGFFQPRPLPMPPNTRVLWPLEPLTLRGFDFDEGRTRSAFAAGREAAEAFARRHENWL